MKERPILFQAAMVRAILDGRKTQTRRLVKPQPRHVHDGVPYGAADPFGMGKGGTPIPCPYGQPGDQLWVRESHWWFKDEPDHETGYYPPTLTVEDVQFRADGDDGRKVWRPSIHMPRWASRITLEVTGVRVERLQDISEPDAQAEGCDACPFVDWQLKDGGPYRNGYARLWESINGVGSWASNPWVWVVDFKRLAP